MNKNKLSHPSWQFIGVVVGIVGLLLNAFAFSDIILRSIGIVVVLILSGAIIAYSRVLPEAEQRQNSTSLSNSNNNAAILPIPPTNVGSSITTPSASSIIGNTFSTARQEAKERLLNEGHNYFRNKIYMKALPAYEQAQWLDPNDPLPYSYQGFVYYEQKKYKEAIDACTKAIDRHGFDPHIYYHQAMAFESLGNNKEARRAYNRGNDNGNSIDYNIFVNDRRVKLHFNTNLIKSFFIVKWLISFLFIVGLALLILTSNFANTNHPDSPGSIFFNIILFSEGLIALAIWGFLSITKKLLGIETISNPSKGIQGGAKTMPKQK
jgi:tetratricopeptide (TPR) repeat protein